MAEKIALNGSLALCTLGKPYKIPGLEPDGVKRSYNSSEIVLSFLKRKQEVAQMLFSTKRCLRRCLQNNTWL